MFDFCNTAQSFEAARACRIHSLNDLVTSRDYNLSAIKYACTLKQPNDPAFEGICYQKIASMKLANLPSKATDVVDFCSSLEPKFQSSCFSRIGRTINDHSIGKDEISNICKNAPADFKDECLGKPVKKNLIEIFK